MTGNKYTFGFCLALAAGILFYVLFTYFTGTAQEYFDVDGKALTGAQLKEADQILESIGVAEYPSASERLAAERGTLAVYRNYLAANGDGIQDMLLRQSSREEAEELLSRYRLREEEAALRIAVLDYCIERLAYASGYPAYVGRVADQAGILLGMELFDANARRRILRTERDFSRYGDLAVSAVSDVGVRRVLADRVGNVTAVLLAVVCAAAYYFRCHAKAAEAVLVRGRAGVFAAVFGVGIALLYLGGLWMSGKVLSLGDLNRPVQSVRDYYASPYLLSVGSVLAVQTGFRIAVCVTLYLAVVGLLFQRPRWLAALLGMGALGAEWLLEKSAAGISLRAAFHGGRYLVSYGDKTLFGALLNPVWELGGFLLVLLAAAAFFAMHGVSDALLLEKARRERAYFDEVNRRYAQTQLIRHDMNNHLTAIAMLLDEGNVEEARRYLGKVTDRLAETKPPVRTGSAVLDAVLFRKKQDAGEKGIRLDIDFAADFAGSGISDYDLCSVFGNLVDNGVEACERLEGEGKVVSLNVRRQEELFCIYCENPYRELRREEGAFATLKGDREAHGLGLKQIGRIAEKYNGTVDIDTSGGVFSISILLVGREAR